MTTTATHESLVCTVDHLLSTLDTIRAGAASRGLFGQESSVDWRLPCGYGSPNTRTSFFLLSECICVCVCVCVCVFVCVSTRFSFSIEVQILRERKRIPGLPFGYTPLESAVEVYFLHTVA